MTERMLQVPAEEYRTLNELVALSIAALADLSPDGLVRDTSTLKVLVSQSLLREIDRRLDQLQPGAVDEERKTRRRPPLRRPPAGDRT